MTLSAARLGSALPVLGLVCGLLGSAPGWAQTPPPGVLPVRLTGATADPGLQCRRAIRAEERARGIPEHLMAAIGRVESGRREADGSVNPWPWSINAEGEDHIYETKAAAIAGVRALQARGVRSIDVGCMQVNLMYHPDAFASLEQAFDPVANVAYAARFLLQLKAQTGAWPAATAAYHSFTPELGADYQRKVMAALPIEQREQPQESVRDELVTAWAATMPEAAPAAHRGVGLSPGGMPLARLLPLAHAGMARIIPMAAGQAARGLDSYRARPIPLAGPGRIPIGFPGGQHG